MENQDKRNALDEEAIYADAWAELKSGSVRPGLWAKAFAESAGDDNKSQALYIALRVQAERDRRRQEQEVANALAAESARQRTEAFFAIVEKLRLKGYEARKVGDGWTVREPLGGRVKLGSDHALLEYAEGRVSTPIANGLCPNCSAEIPQDSARCFKCGALFGDEAVWKILPIPKTRASVTVRSASDQGQSKNRESVQGAPEKESVVSLSGSAPLFLEKTTTGTTNETKKGPSGVGGWLLLLVAGLLVLGPLVGAGRISADIMNAEDQYPVLKSMPQWSNFKSATWWIYLAIVAVSVHGGWGLTRGRDWSVVRRAKIVLWLVGPVASLVMAVIVPLATLGTASAGDARFVGGLLASIIAAGIWTAYLSKSKRVRNTYGPPT
jgi:hypothetical protein